ncbi:MAG: GNAT family N-acetyltransferase, partial [Anaerolineae bacterium]|nr:GNAT family N-acetyltransferase [Anaerolineae bacterium]
MSQFNVYTHAERPEFVEQRDRTADAWAKFMYEDPIANQYWDDLYDYFPEYQIWITNEDDKLIAEGNTIPFAWDMAHEPLPDAGWDAVVPAGVNGHSQGLQPNMLSALAATIAPMVQGQGISALILKTMKKIAVEHGLNGFVAPVRPSQKHRYPLTPMERYITWKHTDGEAPFDPWLRTHWRLGARIVKVAPQSMTIPGTVAEWESWTEMRFPESGTYVVPRALNPVRIDLEHDQG